MPILCEANPYHVPPAAPDGWVARRQCLSGVTPEGLHSIFSMVAMIVSSIHTNHSIHMVCIGDPM